MLAAATALHQVRREKAPVLRPMTTAIAWRATPAAVSPASPIAGAEFVMRPGSMALLKLDEPFLRPTA